MFVRLITWGCGLEIQREIPKKMAMFMAFSATKRDMLVVYCLDPFEIVMK